MEGKLHPPAVSQLEVDALTGQAVRASMRGTGPGPYYEPGASEEEKERSRLEYAMEAEKAESERLAAEENFRSALDEKLVAAFHQGVDQAVDRAELNAWNARSVALYLLVLAVVMMPPIAMIIGLEPEAFGSYIAPVTAIAGTVVGYWFGSGGTAGRSGSESK